MTSSCLKDSWRLNKKLALKDVYLNQKIIEHNQESGQRQKLKVGLNLELVLDSLRETLSNPRTLEEFFEHEMNS